MKRVTSIEKFQKSAQNTLRRFRSWSQDQSSGGNNNNNGGGNNNNGGNNGGGGGGGLRFSSPPTIKSRGKSPPPPPNNNEVLGTPGLQPIPTKQHPSSSSRQQQPQPQQPPPSGTVWDEDELTPLIYGYLHKLGRNGHWQKRFFETNGERLTYYKSGKRTKVLATLDLCKVSIVLYYE
jgi:hypothetical protein